MFVAGFYGYLSSLKTCFLAMLGDFDIAQYEAAPFNAWAVSLLILYVIIVTILLLNLLIAMMVRFILLCCCFLCYCCC